MRRKHAGGQPHKGDRRLIGTRVPQPYGDEIEQRADAIGVSMSEYVAAVLVEHIKTTEPPAHAQGALLSLSEGAHLSRSA